MLFRSISNHDAKGWKRKEKQKQRKYQGQTALDRVRAQCISTNNKLYDACNECTYDACSNAQKACSIFQHFHLIDFNKEF